MTITVPTRSAPAYQNMRSNFCNAMRTAFRELVKGDENPQRTQNKQNVASGRVDWRQNERDDLVCNQSKSKKPWQSNERPSLDRRRNISPPRSPDARARANSTTQSGPIGLTSRLSAISLSLLATRN